MGVTAFTTWDQTFCGYGAVRRQFWQDLPVKAGWRLVRALGSEAGEVVASGLLWV
jgi:hypothetical protein